MKVTGVGSLPHTKAAGAAAFVPATTDVPYLPQLPARHSQERMLRQWGDGLCGCGSSDDGFGLGYGADPGDRAEAFGGADATLALLAEPELIKTQATGPITLGIAMLAGGHPPGVWDCLIEALATRVRDHVDSVETRSGAEVMLMIDEPALSGLSEPGFPMGSSQAADVLGAFREALGRPFGIHCCGETDWAMVAALAPTHIAWDVMSLGRGFTDALAVLAETIDAGTRVIWGAAPTTAFPVPSPSELATRVRRAVGMLVMAGADYGSLTRHSLLSPACGLAALTEDQADAAMGVLGRVEELVPVA